MGWWGDEPPFHTPVFVLTHHAREPEEMEGGTTFFFVTDGIEAAIQQARAAAGEGNVAIGGGANAIQQALAAGLVDELQVHVAPILLGGGTRLFGEGADPIGLEGRAVLACRGRRTSVRRPFLIYAPVAIANVTVREAETVCVPGSTGATSAAAARS